MIKNYKSLCIVSGIFVFLVLSTCFLELSVLNGVVLWLGVLILFILCGKKSVLQNVTIESMGAKEYAVIIISCILTILALTMPMGLSIYNNGTIPDSRNQYELMADSLINGHLYIDREVNEELLAMDNPYDTAARIQQNIDFCWDYALYNGKYYMYFGIVPAILVFVPYKLIFGSTLLTYHVSQLFTGISIIAFFYLFLMLAKKYFPKMAVGTYVFVTAAVSFISLGFCTQGPSLYCTAIVSAICMMLWSIIFYVKAVLYVTNTKLQVVYATLAALFGALAFGCRPPVALANLIALPLAYVYIRNYKGRRLSLIRNFCIILIPYIIVGSLIATYNYVRFDNPFEFGQAYQLTSYDQSFYGSFADRFNLLEHIKGMLATLFEVGVYSKYFPFIDYNGLLITYPLIMFSVAVLFMPKVHKSIKNDRLTGIVAFLGGIIVLIVAIDAYWVPNTNERYRMDEYFLCGILAFILFGTVLKTTDKIANLSRIISLLAVLSMVIAFILFWRGNDYNYAWVAGESQEVAQNLFFLKIWNMITNH